MAVPRGRPPRAAVRAAVRRALADLEPGERILVALSGGPDSMALAAGAAVVARQEGLVCGAVVVDHGLQPGSAEVAARAADQALVLGCSDVEVVRVQVPSGPGSGGPEAAARQERYAALERCATGGGRAGRAPASAVLLGHTLDDQAETVLLALARGSGTRSLSGMAARSGVYRRPLLGLPRDLVARAAADAAAEDHRLEPWSDPQNLDPGLRRVRIRRQALPALVEALGPGIAAALARTAELARDDADALDGWADDVWASIPRAELPAATGPGATMPAAEESLPVDGPTVGLPRAVVTRIVRRFLLSAGCPAEALTAEHVWSVTALLDERPGRADVALPGGRRARRVAASVVVRP